MTTTTTTVVDAYFVTLDDIGDAGLATVLRQELAPVACERLCFVVIERDSELYTLAIDEAWALLALEFQQLQPDADLDMDLPRRALRAVMRGRVGAGDRPPVGNPSITMSVDGIPHLAFGTTG